MRRAWKRLGRSLRRVRGHGRRDQRRGGPICGRVAERGPHRGGRAVAQRRLLAQRAVDDVRESGGNGRIDLADGRRGLEDVLIGDRERNLSGERQPAGEHLEQHDTQRVQIGCGARRSSPRACSGEMYSAVPITEPCWVSIVSSAERATPKSATLSVPSSRTMRFCGFTSRCTIPTRMGRGEPVEGLARIRRGVLGCERRAGRR